MRLPFRKRGNERRRTLLGALLGGLIIALLAYVAVTAGNGLPLKHYYYVNARFGDAAELDKYSDVRIAGKLVGQVLDTSYSRGSPVVKLQLQPSVEPLRADTTARIRLQGLIGAKYVELTPGSAGEPLGSGATLPTSQTSTAVGVFDVLSAFDPRRRADLRATLGGLGQGFLGRGEQLNRAVSLSPTLAANVQSFSDAINARQGAADRFVTGSESLAAAIDPVRERLAGGWDAQARALQPFNDERRSVEATLSQAPGALRTIQTGLAQTDPLLAETAALSHELIAFTRPAPAALREAAALLRDAPAPLAKTRPLARALGSAIPPTLRLLNAVWPLASPIDSAVSNEIPPLAKLGYYSCDVEAFSRDWSMLFSLGSPPETPVGPTGVVRPAVAVNNTAGDVNKPGALHASFWEPPCTSYQDKAP